MRRLGQFVAGFWLRTWLFLGLSSLALVLMLGSPEHIKTALTDAKVYDRIIDAGIESAKAQPQTDSVVPFDDPQIQQIIKQSFDGTQLQNATESFVDASYRWLDGDSENIQFQLDLNPTKQKLADGISDYAAARAAALPPCRAVPAETDIFRLTCLPPYISIEQRKANLRDEILKNQDFLPNPTITTDEIIKNDQGQSIVDQFSSAPSYFQWFKRLPWILLGLAVPTGMAVVMLQRSKRKGIQKIAVAIVGAGVGLLISSIFYALASSQIKTSAQKTVDGSQAAQSVVSDVLVRLLNEFNQILINVGVVTVVVGLIGLVFLYITRPPKSTNHSPGSVAKL